MSLPQPSIPSGFDDFWHSNTGEAEAAPLDYDVSFDAVQPHPSRTGQIDPGTISHDHEIKTFSFRGIIGETLQGWIAYPLTAAVNCGFPVPLSHLPPSFPMEPGSSTSRSQAAQARRSGLPGFLWIAPYGRESVMPNQYGTRLGYVSLSFNFFGEEAFHQERYGPKRGYFTEGVASKEAWVFRRMFQNAAIALRVLADQPAVDSSRIGAMGLSQGGGMSIWLGAWTERVRAVCADMPFLGAMGETLMKNVYRYPLKELMNYMAIVPDGQSRVLDTLAYFDTMNQATRCTKPTLVSVGLKDPAVKPVQARAIFEALPGPKELISYHWGHDWHPEMVETNRRWLDKYLAP